MKFIFKNVRLAFPAVFVAQAMDGGEPKFGATGIADKDHPQREALEAKMLEVAIAKWGPKEGKANYEQLVKKDRVCFRDGADKAKYDGFDGNMYLSASSDARPTVADEKRIPLTKEDGKPYGGCYVDLHVELWAQDNSYGKRINATLTGVQFRKDGDSFSAAAPADLDDFEDLSVEDEDSLA